MADNKKYYYLKLKDNFYDTEEMIILQNMQDGYLYSDILMKLYLRSLKNNGKLMFKDVIPYTPQVLAQVVRHQVGTVEKALKIFQDLGLIEVLDNGAIYMSDIQNFIGESSTEADRIRNYRSKIKQEGLGCTNVQQLYDKSTPEIEIDIEKDIDIKKEIKKEIGNNVTKMLPKCYTDIDIDKKIKKEKYGDFGNVKLTNEELNKLKEIFPNDYMKRIQSLDDYIQSKGKKYKDFVATLKNWARKEGYIFPEKKEKEKVLLVREEYLTEEEWDRYRSGKMTKEEFRKIVEERQCMM